MKRLLIALFCLLSLSASAQIYSPSKTRLYRSNDQIVTADSAGNLTGTYAYSQVRVTSPTGVYLRVAIDGVGVNFRPTQFLNDQGAVWGSTVNAALNAYLASIPSSGGGSGGGGSATTDASQLTSGTLNVARLPGTATVQGNTFNGVNQLVKTDGSGKLPAIDGSQLTNLPSGGGGPALATQAEAILGTDNVKYLSSLRLAQVIANFGFLTPSSSLDNTKVGVDATHRWLTDALTSTWNGKQDALGFTPYNSTNPSGYQTSSQVLTAVGNPANITPDATHRWLTDALSSTWNGKQAGSADLSTISGLTPSNDDFLQRKAGAWANRTIAQVKTDLGVSGSNTGDQDLSSYNTKAVQYNAQTGTTYTLVEGDNGKLVTISNTGAITLTIPPGLSTGWNVTVEQTNVGQISWTLGSGVTANLYPASTSKSAGRYSRFVIEHRGSNVVYINGQIVP